MTADDLEHAFTLAVERATGLADALRRFRVLVLFAGRGDHHHVCDINVARRGGTFDQQRTYECDSVLDASGARWFDRFLDDWEAGVFGDPLPAPAAGRRIDLKASPRPSSRSQAAWHTRHFEGVPSFKGLWPPSGAGR